MKLPTSLLSRQILASSLQRLAAVLLVLACCGQAAAAGHPTPSAELQAALKDHASRLLAGDKDLARLVNQLRPIAASGDPVAKFMLATFIMKSEPDAALSLFHASYEGGCAGAAGAIGALTGARSPAVARAWFVKAAEGGDASSQLFVAGMNERGEGGFPKSKAAAVAWARLARNHALDQSHNPAIIRAAGEFLARVEPALSAAEATEAEAIWSQLLRIHPREPFYLCGQMLP